MEITETNTAQLSPILDMLGVRHVIFRGSPPQKIKPEFQSPDYWVLENSSALPRVFVPQRVEVAPDDDERLGKLARPEFNPREVAYVETPVDLPPECRGAVNIESEIPTRIVVTAQMETPGLLGAGGSLGPGLAGLCQRQSGADFENQSCAPRSCVASRIRHD